MRRLAEHQNHINGPQGGGYNYAFLPLNGNRKPTLAS
jgi:hypothetical protein